jgi:hypothetical protein
VPGSFSIMLLSSRSVGLPNSGDMIIFQSRGLQPPATPSSNLIAKKR